MPDQVTAPPADQTTSVIQDQTFAASQPNIPQSVFPQQTLPDAVPEQAMPLQGQVLPQPPQPSPVAPQPRPLAAMNALLTQAATQEDPLNPANPTSSAKEVSPVGIEFSGELPGGMQSVEELRSVEVAPEVEKYIEEVREDISQLPHEVVVADQKMTQPTAGYAAQPVIVLPMTEEEFKEAGKAPPTTSRRWLKEWTEKIVKIFSGSVVFRQ